MKFFGKIAKLAALGCLAGQMIGCVSSSSLVDIWHDSSFQSPPIARMLVIAVSKDATKRRIWEDAFTGELARQGVTATASYSLYPDALPDTNQVIAAVTNGTFDGILVVLRRPTEIDKHFVKGYTTTVQDIRYSPDYSDSFYHPYWQRYWTYYHEIEHPGYVDSQVVAIREIDVTTTGDKGRLVWSATSRTPDPSSVSDVQKGIVSLVISELTRRNIIVEKK